MTDRRFQRRDPLGDRGLRVTKLRGGSSKGPTLGDRAKGAKILERNV